MENERPILKIKFIAVNGTPYDKAFTSKSKAADAIDMANAVGAKIVDIEEL